MEHPNLVKLIGYCALDDERGIQRLLVYEYMPNKSLEFHLFNKAYDPLPWKTRLEIALGAAQGLTYLHEQLEIQVRFKKYVYRLYLLFLRDIYDHSLPSPNILSSYETWSILLF